MNRILLALLAAFTLLGSAHAGDAKKPNIIYILADDKDYHSRKTHVVLEKTWEIPSIYENWRSAKFGRPTAIAAH